MFGEGKIIEHELLGQPKMSFEQLHDLEIRYEKYTPALEYVKTHQRGDPFHPVKFFPKVLHEKLKAELDIPNEKLAYYTALGSALDHFHGVDAFFEYTPADHSVVRVTLDVTTNPNKDRYKADVILAIPRGGIDPKDAGFSELIDQYVKEIKAEILTKLNK